MGTKEQEQAVSAATNAINGFDSSTGVMESKRNDTHTSDSSNTNTTIGRVDSKPISTTTTNEKLQATAKAQVVIIPATSASTVATNAAKKIRRAFSMPRNPFQWSRKFKTNGGIIGGEPGETLGGRGSNSALTACVGGGRSERNGSIVSLNSYTAVCKDEVGGEDKKNAINVGRQLSAGIGGLVGNNATNSGSNSGGVGGSASTANRVFRRSSLRKFINRIAQHVSTSVNIGANKHASSQANSLSSSDRVPPIGGYQWPADQTPGVTGLKNHGNTCFMNAVLQCLSHTDILAEYFVLDQYKADLKRRNKINSRKFGTKGELTEQLANVLKALWTCKNENDHSTSFKAVVDRYGSQFRSSTQHDAQEFLFWLLDKVHEDLNTATKRRYKSVKNNYGRSDEIIAAETLANHIRCNNSFVQAVFQAQFRSSLTCPRCKKQSNTFDPFHCISVQLPQLQQQTIFVTVLYLKQHPGQVKLGLTVPAGSPIVALRDQLHADTGIASDSMVLVDINETGFTRVFYDTQPVSTLAGIETIYCIEVPEPHKKDESPKANETTSTTNNCNTAASTASTTINSSSTNTTDLLLLIANVKKKKKLTTTASVGSVVSDSENSTERFGIPFCLRATRDCSYVELQKKLLREMSIILKPEVFSYAAPLSDMFQIRLQDPSADPDTYLEQVEHPLLTEMIDLALSVLSAEAGPAHIKLLLEWSEPEAYFSDMSNAVVEHESVARLLEKKTNDTAALTLEQCLEHYTKAETLSAEDAWRCPHCQQYLPVVKTLGLWSLPDILVVHFKRFRQHQAKGPNAAKLTTMVKFPLNAFDMSPHLAKGIRDDDGGKETSAQNQNADTFPSSGQTARPSPWKKTRQGDSRSSTLNSYKENRETRYDLYAVCYHQGDTLETGHYTAACKNPYDHQWYKFDDQRVSKVPSDAIEEDIINNEAYMLFYQRRKTDIAECSGSSSTSGEHWVSKIAPPLPTSATTTVATTVTKYTNVATNEVATTTSASALKPEMPPENTERKPVEIPNVESVIVKPNLEEIAEDVSKVPTLTQMVVNEKESLTNNVVIDGIEYVDDGAEDADVDELEILEQLTPTITGSPTTDDVNQIFVMDEDCKLNDIRYNDNEYDIENYNALPTTTEVTKLVITNGAVNSNSTPIKSKSPILLTASVGGAVVKSEMRKSSPVPQRSTNGTTIAAPSPNQNTNGRSISPQNSSVSSSASSLSSRSSPHSLAVSTYGATTLQSKFNGFSTASSANNYQKETVLLSSSLKSNSSSIIAAAAAAHSNDFLHNRQHYQQQHWHGSRSSVSAVENATSSTHHPQHHTHCLNLRHSFSTSSNYKLKECSDTLSSMLRNSANTCSKDTLIFIDQQQHHHHHHSLIEDDDDTFMDNRSLWISPVTPHKLITVSPKN